MGACTVVCDDDDDDDDDDDNDGDDDDDDDDGDDDDDDNDDDDAHTTYIYTHVPMYPTCNTQCNTISMWHHTFRLVQPTASSLSLQ